MKRDTKKGREMYWTDQWQYLTGKNIEVLLDGALHRRGIVEMVMPDASGLWLAADGTDGRQFIERERGFEVWADLLSGPWD